MSCSITSVKEEEEGEGRPKIARCRFLESSDLPVVAGMIRCQTIETHSDAALNPRNIHEYASLSLVLENELNEIVAAAMLCNYPNIPSLSQGDWPAWMQKFYKVDDCNEANTLFVHLLVWDDDYEDNFLKKLLTAVYYTHAFCRYVIIVVPPSVTIADTLKNQMMRVYPDSYIDQKVQVLYVSDKLQEAPDTTYRLAVEEDNDDVVGILDLESKRLRDFYGEYYVSEMLRHPFRTRRLVVGGKTAGVVDTVACLNTSVNLRVLVEIFDLEAFGNLKKRNPDALSLRLRAAPSRTISEHSEIYDDFLGEYCYEGEEEDQYSFESMTMKSDKTRSTVAKSKSQMGKSVESLKLEKAPCGNETCDCPSEESFDYLDNPDKCDVFAIELFAYASKVDELRSQSLLRASFNVFPDLDYCLVLLPTERPYSPFLDHFTRVPYKPDQEYPMTMYLTHRKLHESALRVRKARYKHLPSLECLLEGLENADELLHEYERIMQTHPDDREDEDALIITCDDIVVGAAIVCLEGEVNKLRHGYRVENLAAQLPQHHQQQRSGRILSLCLMPIFNVRLAYFLSEIARLHDYRVIYYRAYTSKDISPVVNVMQSVEPRVNNWPQLQRYFDRNHSDAVFEEPFALFLMTPRMTTVKKEQVNTRIVVVGASESGLAFIDMLALGFKYPQLQFTDITLVSPDGHPYENSGDEEARLMIPFRGLNCRFYQNLVPRRLNYNVVKGTVIKIDRELQCVHIEDSGILSYDYLVIAPKMKYDRPDLKNQSTWDGNRELQNPTNCYYINNDSDAERVLSELQKLTNNFEKKKAIVVHGRKLDCFSALGALLELGLDGSWVTLALSRSRNDDEFQDDPQLLETVLQIMESESVDVICDCDIMDWDVDPNTNRLKCLLVKNDSEGLMTIACDALLTFQNKSLCPKLLHALSESGLETSSGRLVIDEEFRTNDRRIFAAGKITRYSKNLRRYGCLDQAHYDSREIGEKLAEKFARMILSKYEDPLIKNNFQLPQRISDVVQTQCAFVKPVVIAALFPGGYRYLSVRKPGSVQCLKKGDEDDDEDEGAMTTGSSDTGYFRLRLNQFRIVESITCFTKTDFEIQNMILLYGKHEALLGDLKARFSNSEIDDFFGYFKQPWMTALFSDDFDRFLKTTEDDVYNLIGSDKASTRRKLYDIITRYDYSPEIPEDEREKILAEYCSEACYLVDIEDAVTEFVEGHEGELGGLYWTGDKDRMIRREIENTPLLKLESVRAEDDDDSRCDCDRYSEDESCK